MPPQKALDAIGRTLQMQYERWQSRARYRQSLDPTYDEVRKLCLWMRRSAKDERVLFHYAGHGVPRPTANGEIWVFNKSYTQYIPLAVFDLHSWLGTPSVLVVDSSGAGVIVDAFTALLQLGANGGGGAGAGAGAAGGGASGSTADHGGGGGGGGGGAGAQPGASPFDSVIILAACGANESLPTSPELPADLFTSCLTTPIHMVRARTTSCRVRGASFLPSPSCLPRAPRPRRRCLRRRRPRRRRRAALTTTHPSAARVPHVHHVTHPPRTHTAHHRHARRRSAFAAARRSRARPSR
jgi:hypothetical protein